MVLAKLYLLMVISLIDDFVLVEGANYDLNWVETIVKQWAPLIWLAPEEKFMPLNVEEFLDNMAIANEHGSVISRSKHVSRFFLYNSRRYFLVPTQSLESLKQNTTSFLYGKNPKAALPTPVYAVVTYCALGFHVTYWAFYPFNEGKDACFLGKVPAPTLFSKCLGHYRKLGNHVGDWERMSLSFTNSGEPEQMFLSVHDAGAYYDYNTYTKLFRFRAKLKRKGVAQVPEFPDYVRLQGGHPVLFAAEGSHGLWATPGDHEFIRVPKIVDKTGYGIPWKTWAVLKVHHLGVVDLPSWMTFKGQWGNPKTKCVLLKKFGLCEYSEGPKGLLRDSQDFYC